MLPRNFTTCRFGTLDYEPSWPNHRANHFAIEDHRHVAVAVLEVAHVVVGEVAHAVAGVAALVAAVTVVDRELDQDQTDDDAAAVRVAARKEEKKVDPGHEHLNARDTHAPEAEDDRAPRINQRIQGKNTFWANMLLVFLHFPPFCLFTPS